MSRRSLVSSGEGILRILMEYVDGKTLGHINIAKQPVEKRKTWAKQLEHPAKTLHWHNIIWGDAKASNVLIDRTDDRAWLIDFGGSFTNGRIEPQLRETKEGDLQGLGKIIEFLEDGTSDLEKSFYSDDDEDMEDGENEE
jgi:tRNA A-37 threonylcarbamoyl transferase component Bud32